MTGGGADTVNAIPSTEQRQLASANRMTVTMSFVLDRDEIGAIVMRYGRTGRRR
jgi:hypothetical protein